MTTADGRTGSTVGKYRLHEVVGRGGMGVVYRAEHVYIGREVAVKILHEGYGGREESIKRFLREARAASLINHPNIVEVTDFGKASDGTVFFVMELLVGEPLDNILARDQRLDLLRSITICNQLTAALAAAHSKGIIHRDLKPENVMLIPREGRRELVRRVSDESGAYELTEREKQFDFVKILDFGVAKVREPDAQKGRVTNAGVVFGTPEYMAPETARVGYSDARSDIYALGIMFYEMMTGTVPFLADSPVEVMMKQVNERVPAMRQVAPDAEITEDAERMILKALAKDPDQRQQSMEEFHHDLQKCYGQLRFRRTLRSPSADAGNTPPATTIPLTKKKRPAGAVPMGYRVGGSSPGELETSNTPASAEGRNPNGRNANGGVRPRGVTPPLPGLPLNAATPILLTKKKSARPERTDAAVELNANPTAPATPEPVTSAAPPYASTPQDRLVAGEINTGSPPAARVPGPPARRATLPLGQGLGATPVAPAATFSVGAPPAAAAIPQVTPPTNSTETSETSEARDTALGDPEHSGDLGYAAIDVHLDQHQSWLEAQTAPSLPGYPYSDEAGDLSLLDKVSKNG